MRACDMGSAKRVPVKHAEANSSAIREILDSAGHPTVQEVGKPGGANTILLEATDRRLHSANSCKDR